MSFRIVEIGAGASAGLPLFDITNEDLVLNLSLRQDQRAVDTNRDLTKWDDTSGEGNDAAIFNNAKWVGATDLGGYDGLIAILSPTRFIRRLTLVGGTEPQPLWVAFPVDVKRDTAGNRALFDSASVGNNFLVLQQGANLTINAGASLVATGALTTGKHYCVCIFDGADSRIYVDDMVTARITGNAGTGSLIGYTMGAQNSNASPADADFVEMIVGREVPSQDVLNALGKRAEAFFDISVITDPLVDFSGVVPPEPMVIIVGLGQSNMVGDPDGGAFPSPWDVRFPAPVPMRGDVGGSAFTVIPLTQANTDVYSAAISLTWRFFNAGRRVGLVWVAKGTTGLGATVGGEWLPGAPDGSMLVIAKAEYTSFAGQIFTKSHDAVLWSQGEQDADDSTAANAYRTNHDSLRSDWASFTGDNPSWQMVPNHLDFASAPVSLAFNSIVRGHQIDVGNLPNFGIVDSDNTILIGLNAAPSFTSDTGGVPPVGSAIYLVDDLIHHGGIAGFQSPLGGGARVARTGRLDLGDVAADNLGIP